MSYDAALGSDSKVLIVNNDKKIVGRGSIHIRHGNHWVGVQFDEGEVLELVKPYSLSEKGSRLTHAYFRFFPISGMFFDLPWQLDEASEEAAFNVFGDLRIVDEFNFGFRWVPKWFWDVEGCGAKLLSQPNPYMTPEQE